MTELVTTYTKCPRCQGTGDPGIILDGDGGSVPDPTCPTCNGEKYVILGQIGIPLLEDTIDAVAWIKKKIKKILNKLEIEDEE